MSAPLYDAPQVFSVIQEVGALPMEGKAMPHKKTQLAPKHEGRPPLLEAARTFFGERSGHQSLRSDLKSIVSAARLLPMEVAPPARVWRSLRVQLEKEGILSRSVNGRLEEHTRFPMFRN
jgi:hypothetical protein